MTSSDLCGQLENDCPGSIFDSGETLRNNILLSCFSALLLILLFFTF